MHDILAKANFDRDAIFFSPLLASRHRWEIHSINYPTVDVTFNGTKPLRVRLQCDQWEELPPSAILLAPNGNGPAGDLPGGTFHPDAHPVTGKPFVCMRGFREYHTHPNHSNDSWANYRGHDGMNLSGLVVQLSVAWRKAVGL